MSFRKKLDNAHKELHNTKMWKSNYDTPIYKAARLLRLKLKPPLYNSFLSNFIFSAMFFGITWGLIMWFWVWEKQGMTFLAGLVTASISGCLFGLFMSIYYKFIAKKYKLSSWDDL